MFSCPIILANRSNKEPEPQAGSHKRTDWIRERASTAVWHIVEIRREPRGFGAKALVGVVDRQENVPPLRCFSVEQSVAKVSPAPTKPVPTGIPPKGVRRAKWFKRALMLDLLLCCSTHPLHAREVPTIRWEASGSHEDVW